jgi:hypothetical protein
MNFITKPKKPYIKKGIGNANGGRYIIGQKRCQICSIFINYDDGVYCPCCNSKLRTRPRGIASVVVVTKLLLLDDDGTTTIARH